MDLLTAMTNSYGCLNHQSTSGFDASSIPSLLSFSLGPIAVPILVSSRECLNTAGSIDLISSKPALDLLWWEMLACDESSNHIVITWSIKLAILREYLNKPMNPLSCCLIVMCVHSLNVLYDRREAGQGLRRFLGRKCRVHRAEAHMKLVLRN